MFLRLGFHVWQVGGVSRAWRRFFNDGSYLLITDACGYDLPEREGPYCAMFLSARDALIEHPLLFWRSYHLVRWIRHAERTLSVKGNS